MDLERRGVPTATLCTTPFVDLAHRQAEALGLPDLPVVHIVMRLAERSADELEALVDQAFDAMCEAVTARPGGDAPRSTR